MNIILSPAKTMDFSKPIGTKVPKTFPFFIQNSKRINKRLRELDSDILKNNMNLSDSLLLKVQELINNYTGKKENGRQAFFAYQGAVFKGIDVYSLKLDHLNFAQKYFRILSAQYGILKPLDLIEEYRLDLKTKLKIADFTNLYKYWENPFLDYFSNTEKTELIINLSSAEFSKAINFSKLNSKVINIIFGELHADKYKSPPMYSKMARGRMAGFIIRNYIIKPEDIKSFNHDGYKFNKNFSNKGNFVFTR